MTTVFGSLDLGSAIGLLACPPLIRMFGWSSVFSIFAIIGTCGPFSVHVTPVSNYHSRIYC